MKKRLLLFLLCATGTLFGQDYWAFKEQKAPSSFQRNSLVNEVVLNQKGLMQVLKTGPALSNKGKEFTLFFPNEKHQLEAFNLKQIPLFSPEIAQQYPQIKAYSGQSKTRKNVRIRITLSPKGISGTMRTPSGMVFLQPKKEAEGEHIYYQRKESLSKEIGLPFCRTAAASALLKDQQALISQKNKRAVGVLKTYRFAVVGTAEYTQFWGDDDDSNGTNQEDALVAVANTVNRMNEIFEVDLGLRLELVTTASMLYTDTTTDPFTGSFNSEIQTTLTREVGEANYDLGHLFHRGQASGDAGSVGNVCQNGAKGSAFSAHPFTATNGSGGSFLTDYFDIDYVIHEVGHQFGALHTFSHDTEPFGYNSEPGSGATIMSYAGIINGQNMQRHSDPYFHFNSIKNINDYLNTKSCQANITTTNEIPVVNAGQDYIIPKGTAYTLSAVATDTDALTYCWEQLDSGQVRAGDFGPNLLSGSTNRSLLPSASAQRTIPRMSSVLAGNLTEVNPTIGSAWETVSLVERSLRWGVTVRDRDQANPDGVGFTAQDEMNIRVEGSAGPFRVNSQDDASVLWLSGANEQITWDVANTNQAPVNTSLVNIYLSLDAGASFPILLAENIPNNGTAYIEVPGQISSTQARIKIQAKDNIYFAVNRVNFTIQERAFALPFVQAEKTVCGLASATYAFRLQQYQGDTAAVSLAVSGLPSGVTAVLTQSVLNTNGAQASLELNTDGTSTGTYSLTLVGTVGNTVVAQVFSARFYAATIPSPELRSPINNAEEQSTSLVLSWEENIEATQYRLQISAESTFSDLVVNELVTTAAYSVSQLLSEQTYYWRVSTINQCGESDFSAPFQFTTGTTSCGTYLAANVPRTILDSTSSSPGVTEIVIQVADDLPIIDIDVKVDVVHTYVEDLSFSLVHPDGRAVLLIQNQGGSGNNFNQTVFDAEAPIPIQSGSPPFAGTFQPLGDLTSFYNSSSRGNWRLKVTDNAVQDTGVIEGVTLVMCLGGQIEPNDDNDLFPNNIDNCPLISNPNQTDSDGDGEGDLCDVDAQRNFSLFKTDETCVSQDNGSIVINAIAQFTYQVNLSGSNGISQFYQMTNQRLEISDLQSGDYLLCITSLDAPGFEQCFATTITQPLPLNISAKVNASKEKVTLQLGGSDRYFIRFNEVEFETVGIQQKELPLQKGLNIIEVSTKLSCQGTYKEVIYLDSPSTLYPNPVQDNLSVLVGGESPKAQLSIYSIQGRKIHDQQVVLDVLNRAIQVSVAAYPPGNYIVKIVTDKNIETLKFIKQ